MKPKFSPDVHTLPTTSKLMRKPRPSYRQLRAFAFDPILSRQIETYDVNEVTIRVPWDAGLCLGPGDSYIKVIDFDPTMGVFYAPVDLNDPEILAAGGLPPSEGSPQFHQQMVYAVARTTIAHFEKALGRKILWSPHVKIEHKKGDKDRFIENSVEQLRIYPHAMRDKNAYYSPEKKALLFGYFPASSTRSGQNMPGEVVFTCLSHDIVAHETTHAIIDGLHPRFIEPSNRDVLALHEAIADIVALFQHFTYPNVLKHQIARTKGNLEKQNLLGELAFQFGQAIGHYGALRSAIGDYVDGDKKEWVPKKPDPMEIQEATEPHIRGSILVAAIFDAFLTVYRYRVRDLIRIATSGTGELPPGDIHPDLVDRLAEEASKTAEHILHICIRALDYSPPVDINFGDYLRAIITADYELVSDDPFNYRLAIIDAFRKRGIYPKNIRNLSVESLLWHVPSIEEQRAFEKVLANTFVFRWEEVPGISDKKLKDFLVSRYNEINVDLTWIYDAEITKSEDRKTISISIGDKSLLLTLNNEESKAILKIGKKIISPLLAKKENGELNIYANIKDLEELRELVSGWSTSADRKEIFNRMKDARRLIHKWFTSPDSDDLAKAAHIVFEKKKGKKGICGIFVDKKGIRPSLEVHSVRPARRYGPDGQTVTELVIEMTQRRRGYFRSDTQKAVDEGTCDGTANDIPDPDFIFRGGCTLLVDPVTAKVRYCIYKDISNDRRLKEMREFLMEGASSLQSTYFGDPRQEYFRRLASRGDRPPVEPFMLLHRFTEAEEEI